MRKVPDTIEGYEPLAASLLTDRHHGVLLAAVTLMLEVCADCKHLSSQHQPVADSRSKSVVEPYVFLPGSCSLNQRMRIEIGSSLLMLSSTTPARLWILIGVSGLTVTDIAVPRLAWKNT